MRRRLLGEQYYCWVGSSGFFSAAFPTEVEEKLALTWLPGEAVPVGALCVIRGGGGAGVRLAQGALVTPSTIPIGGFDVRVAQGAVVPWP